MPWPRSASTNSSMATETGGVGLCEGVVAEEGVEDGQGDHVLGHHLDGGLLGDAGVEGVP